MDLISRLADRILVMENGGIAADTTPVRLFALKDAGDARPRERLGQPVRRGASGQPGRPGLCDLLAAVDDAGIPVDPACFDLEEAADMIRASVFNDNYHASPGDNHPC